MPIIVTRKHPPAHGHWSQKEPTHGPSIQCGAIASLFTYGGGFAEIDDVRHSRRGIISTGSIMEGPRSLFVAVAERDNSMQLGRKVREGEWPQPRAAMGAAAMSIAVVDQHPGCVGRCRTEPGAPSGTWLTYMFDEVSDDERLKDHGLAR